jgi:hypothetical protein
MRFYACERGFFNDREMELLQELVEDISFALGLMKGNSGGQMPEIP